MNKRKLVSLCLIVVFLLGISLGTLAFADKGNSGKADKSQKDVKSEEQVQDVDGEVIAKEEEGTNVKGKKGNGKTQEWKDAKSTLEALKDGFEAQKDELELKKTELEKLYEEAKLKGDEEAAKKLAEELQVAKQQMEALKGEMKSVKLDMKALIKADYTAEELQKLEATAAAITSANEGVTPIPVESIIVKGKKVKFDVPPVIKDGRILLPVRAFSEAIGASVEWNAEERKVTITKGEIEIVLYLDSVKVYVNGVEKEIDVPAKSLNGRTVVPIRFIVESLGLKVEWDSETGTAEIEDPAAEAEETEEEATADEATSEEATTTEGAAPAENTATGEASTESTDDSTVTEGTGTEEVQNP